MTIVREKDQTWIQKEAHISIFKEHGWIKSIYQGQDQLDGLPIQTQDLVFSLTLFQQLFQLYLWLMIRILEMLIKMGLRQPVQKDQFTKQL